MLSKNAELLAQAKALLKATQRHRLLGPLGGDHAVSIVSALGREHFSPKSRLATLEDRMALSPLYLALQLAPPREAVRRHVGWPRGAADAPATAAAPPVAAPPHAVPAAAAASGLRMVPPTA